MILAIKPRSLETHRSEVFPTSLDKTDCNIYYVHGKNPPIQYAARPTCNGRIALLFMEK